MCMLCSCWLEWGLVIIVLNLGGVGRSGIRSGWKKTKEEKIWCDATDLVSWPRKTRLKIQLQPVNFCFFFTKTTSFWFFFKKIDPVTRLKLETLVLNRAGHRIGSKNTHYLVNHLYKRRRRRRKNQFILIYINEQLNVIYLFDIVNIRWAQILFFE